MQSSTATRGRTLPRRRHFSPGPEQAGSVAFSIPLGLSDGGPFRPLSRAISSRCAAMICFRSLTSAKSCAASSFNWADDRSSRIGGGLTHCVESEMAAVANPESEAVRHSAGECDISDSPAPIGLADGFQTGRIVYRCPEFCRSYQFFDQAPEMTHYPRPHVGSSQRLKSVDNDFFVDSNRAESATFACNISLVSIAVIEV